MSAPPRATAASLRPGWRAQAAALSLAWLVGCGAEDEAVCPSAAPVGPEGPRLSGVCPPTAPTASPSTGRFTRVAALDDRHLVAVSLAAAPGAIRVVLFGPDGSRASPPGERPPEAAAILAEVELLPPVLSGGAGAARAGTFPAVAAQAGWLHVAWHDPTGGRLLHAAAQVSSGPDGSPSLAFGTPGIVAGGPTAAAGTQLSLALDGGGGVHLVFREEAPGGATASRPSLLRYATRPPGPATDGAGWALEVVDGSDDATHPALVLVPGPDGLPSPRVAFHDAREGDLELAARVDGGAGSGPGRWRVTTLDGRDPVTGRDTGEVGAFASMALTPGRSLAIVYHDATAGTLRALTPGEPPRVLDDGRWQSADGRVLARSVGQFARLAITPDGVWHVVHLEADGPRWRYLRLSGERVTVATELDGLGPGGWLDLAPLGSDLAGAYGAFRDAGALATSLRFFSVRATGGAP